ncbi:MAG: polysaccharide deacetylase family protein [Candidatus Latescibacterota bacterium]
MISEWLNGLEYIPPAALKRLLSGIRWEGAPDSGSLALTFDDGPDPDITPAVLDVMDSLKARGTFFLVGEQVKKHPSIARQIVERGQAIGNHSMTHSKLLFMKRSEVDSEIDSARQAIADACGVEPTMFRPPYGMFDHTTARAVRDRGLEMVLWTVLSGDYSKSSESKILQRINPFIRAGAIIVFHDTIRGGGSLLPGILKEIGVTAIERGIRLGGVDELSTVEEIDLGEENAG